MSRKSRCIRQRVSGWMAFVVVFIYIFNYSCLPLSYGAASAGAATGSNGVRDKGVTLKSHPAEDVQIAVMSRQAGYEAGDFVCLDLYVRNNTQETITGGRLRYKAKGIEEGTAYFEYAEGSEAWEESWEEEPDGQAGRILEDGALREDVRDMVIYPGEDCHVQFHFQIDYDIQEMKNQKVDFTFLWEKEGNLTGTEETFRYVAGGMNLLPVEPIDVYVPKDGADPVVYDGEKARMELDFDLGQIQEIIEEKLWESGGGIIQGETATGSDAETASRSDAARAGKTGKNATSSDADNDGFSRWIKWEGDSLGQGEKPVIKGLACRLDTYGVNFEEFQVMNRDEESNFGASAVCMFKINRDVKLGVYYGTVMSTYRFEGRQYMSSQSFALRVMGEDAKDTDNTEDTEQETGSGELAEDEAVAQVIRLIDDLPEPEEIEAALKAFEDAGDTAGYEAYYAGLYEQVMYAYERYQALTEEQKELVYNRDKLLALEWIWGSMPAAETGIATWKELKSAIEGTAAGETKEICLEGNISNLPKDPDKPVEDIIPIKIPQGAKVTLDLNGKTLTFESDVKDQQSLKNLFEVEKDGTFTIACSSQTTPVSEEALINYRSRSRMVQGIDSDGYKDAMEKESRYDRATKTVTYYVINSMTSDMEFKKEADKNNASAKRYRIHLDQVGAIEGSYINNAVAVKEGGTLYITNGRITAVKSNRAVLVEGGTAEITGGYIVGNDERPTTPAPSNGGGVSVISGGQLVMTGGMIAGNKVIGNSSTGVPYEMGNGGGISVRSGSSAVIGGDAVIAGNIAYHGNGGGIFADGGSSVKVEDDAVIAGNLAEAELKNVSVGGKTYPDASKSNFKGSGGGIYIAPFQRGSSKNTLIVEGGVIAGNVAEACADPRLGYGVGGGGIFTGGDLRVGGDCHIENNYAFEGGGGIMIWYKNNATGHSYTNNGYHYPTFYMSGGTVRGNTCDGSEGGGIRCEGTGTIEKGVIEGNITNSFYDFGGGGIYVEMYTDHIGEGGNLSILNAEITENVAYGYGGGVAGCAKSVMNVLTIKGAAIYGNEVRNMEGGKVCGNGKAGDETVTEQNYPEFFKDPGGGARTDIALDYFGVGQSVVYDYMLGNGSHDWTGNCGNTYVLKKGEDTNKPNPLTVGKKSVMGLTSNPSSEHIAGAAGHSSVIIRNNQSRFHGGGIACNGVLALGKGSGNLRIEKKLDGDATEKEFEFTIGLKKGGAPLEGDYPYSGSREGWIEDGGTIRLKAGEFIEIMNLPGGTEYTVTEINHDGYKVSITKNGGKGISGNSVTGTIVVTDKDGSNVEIIVVTNRDKDKPEETVPPTSETETSTSETETSTPETEPTAPETRPTTPGTEPTTPETRPTTPGTEPTTPETQPTTPETTRPSETQPTSPETTHTNPERTPSPPPSTTTVPETVTEPSTEPTLPAESTDRTPEEPDVPVLTEFPDPNDPDSPERFIIVEDGVPKAYVKRWDPEKEEFVYIYDGDVPLFGLPRMGDAAKGIMRRVMWFALLGIAGEGIFQAVVKRRRKNYGSDHDESLR